MVLYAQSKDIRTKERNKENTEREQKEGRRKNKNKLRKTKQTASRGAGRVPRTRVLFPDAISPMICSADGPTQGRHKKTIRKARRREKGRDKEQRTKNKRAVLCPVGSR